MGRAGPCNHAVASESRQKFVSALTESLTAAGHSAGLPSPPRFTCACLGFSGGPADKKTIVAELLASERIIVTERRFDRAGGRYGRRARRHRDRGHRLHRFWPQCRWTHRAGRRLGLSVRRRRRRIRYRAPSSARRLAAGRRLGPRDIVARHAAGGERGARCQRPAASFLYGRVPAAAHRRDWPSSSTKPRARATRWRARSWRAPAKP